MKSGIASCGSGGIIDAGSQAGFPSPVLPPSQRKALPWCAVVMLLVMVLSIIAGPVAIVRKFALSDAPRAVRGSCTPSSSGPTVVLQGGEVRVNGNNEARTIACNDGERTLTDFNGKYHEKLSPSDPLEPQSAIGRPRIGPDTDLMGGHQSGRADSPGSFIGSA